jgi:hypothetical protein
MVSHGDQTGVHFDQVLDIRPVNPNVTGTQPIRRPAGDYRDSGRRDRFTGHKLSSHSPRDEPVAAVSK